MYHFETVIRLFGCAYNRHVGSQSNLIHRITSASDDAACRACLAYHVYNDGHTCHDANG